MRHTLRTYCFTTLRNTTGISRQRVFAWTRSLRARGTSSSDSSAPTPSKVEEIWPTNFPLPMWEKIPEPDSDEAKARLQWRKVHLLGCSAVFITTAIGIKVYSAYNPGTPIPERQRRILKQMYAYFGGGVLLSALVAGSVFSVKSVAKITKRFPYLVMGFGLFSTIVTGNTWSDRAVKASLDSESSARKYLRWFSLAFSQGLMVAPLYVLSPAVASRGFVLILASLCTTSYTVATMGTSTDLAMSKEWLYPLNYTIVGAFAVTMFLPLGLRPLRITEYVVLALYASRLNYIAGSHVDRIMNPEQEKEPGRTTITIHHPIDGAIGISYGIVKHHVDAVLSFFLGA